MLFGAVALSALIVASNCGLDGCSVSCQEGTRPAADSCSCVPLSDAGVDDGGDAADSTPGP